MIIKKQEITKEKFEVVDIDNVALANNNHSNVIVLKRLK
jgi:hypothetical protein